jgi:hypothetical protein
MNRVLTARQYDTDSLFRFQCVTAQAGGKKSFSSTSSSSHHHNHSAVYVFTFAVADCGGSPPSNRASPFTPSTPLVPFAPHPQDATLFNPPDPTQMAFGPFADLPFEAYNYPDIQETSLSAFLANPVTLNFVADPIPESIPEDGITSEALFQFFEQQLGSTLPYVDLFQTAAATWFSTSVHNPALRQAVLAIRLLTVDPSNHDKANEHLQWALTLLRRSEVSDGGGAIGYFLCAHFSMMLGNQTWARDHLRALKSLVPSPLRTDKLTKLIWRMAVRIDFMASIASGKPPILPRYLPAVSILLQLITFFYFFDFIIPFYSYITPFCLILTLTRKTPARRGRNPSKLDRQRRQL